MDTTTFPLPGTGTPVTVVPAPGAGPQEWAGAAAVHPDGDGLVISYRVRSAGSDHNVIARSEDGERLDPIAVVHPGDLGAAMVERPALARTDDGRWQLFVSGAEPGTKRWWVGLLEADTPEGLAAAELRRVFPDQPGFGIKDPVIRRDDDLWRAWLCCHPLDVPGAEDRMVTAYATSHDGHEWDWHGDVLAGRTGCWDARGARVTAVLDDGRAAYDGRPSAEANWFEQTGVAAPVGDGPRLAALDQQPAFDARYLTVHSSPGAGTRIWYEFRLPDGSHELRTELLQP